MTTRVIVLSVAVAAALVASRSAAAQEVMASATTADGTEQVFGAGQDGALWTRSEDASAVA